MKLPYEHYDELFVCAIKMKGVIYMCSFESEAQREKEETMTGQYLNAAKQGLKFQQFLLSGAYVF